MSGDIAPTEAPDHQPIPGPAGQTPYLALAGFAGPLAQMLLLARTQKLDLAKLSLRDFIAQLTGALCREAPITHKAEWIGMASWVVLLRSGLLLPGNPAAQANAEAVAQTLPAGLMTLQEMQAVTAWLNARPQLGQDVFARGAPEISAPGLPGGLSEADHQLDVIEFLWATIALLDDGTAVDRDPLRRPLHLDLHKVSEARERIIRLVVGAAQTKRLHELVPPPAVLDRSDATAVRRHKSGWTSTFVAALELAKQGEISLAQNNPFDAISVSKTALGLLP